MRGEVRRVQRGTMEAPDQDTGLALGVWPQLGIVWPELALKCFCGPEKQTRDRAGGRGVHPLSLTRPQCLQILQIIGDFDTNLLYFRNVKTSRKQAAMSFPICCQARVFQAGISNGAEEAVGKSCRLAAEPSHFLTHLHIKAHSSSTNEQLAQLSRRGASVDLQIGWIVLLRLAAAWIPPAWTPLQSPPCSSRPLMDRLNQ